MMVVIFGQLMKHLPAGWWPIFENKNRNDIWFVSFGIVDSFCVFTLTYTKCLKTKITV